MADPKILYAGVAICADARAAESSDGVLAIDTAAPMPVGAILTLDAGDGPVSARVVESIEGAPGRMRLALGAVEPDRPERPAAEKKKGRKKAGG